jgi:hypothetical protein
MESRTVHWIRPVPFGAKAGVVAQSRWNSLYSCTLQEYSECTVSSGTKCKVAAGDLDALLARARKMHVDAAARMGVERA